MAERRPFVITVFFTVKPDTRSAFRDAVVQNAALSLEREEGCRVFDVCESLSDPEFFLYELYDSERDFQLHLASEHFRDFDRLSSSWVISKKVTSYHRLPFATAETKGLQS